MGQSSAGLCSWVWFCVLITERDVPYLEPVLFHSISPHPAALAFSSPSAMMFLGLWSYGTDIPFTAESKTVTAHWPAVSKVFINLSP